MGSKKTFETQVLVIGGGATGTGIARDLAMRGVKAVLVEKKDLNAGASGGNHGLLHSGARYIASDPEAAIECRQESLILKKTISHCIEDTGGLFVAVKGDDEAYIADFPVMCEKAGIPFEEIPVKEALEMEPVLSPETIAAFKVNDASINPFRLSIDNMNHAVSRGGTYLRHCRVASFDISNQKINCANVENLVSGETFQIQAQVYVNAGGAWAAGILEKAGIQLHMVYSKGSLLVTSKRITHRVINRLRQATDADILVPGGVVSILGTTSVRVDDPDHIFPTVEEVDQIIDEGQNMVPFLGSCRYVRAYSGVRPLVSLGAGDDRSVSRGYTLLDHGPDNVHNLVTITGGKLTTYRLMAEKTCDIVCEKLKVDVPGETHFQLLPNSPGGEYSDAGHFYPKIEDQMPHKDDTVLCECEMVRASAIDQILSDILKNGGIPDLSGIAIRSRVGKGPCQGTFCSMRLLAYLYQERKMAGRNGVADLKTFLNERWKGEHSLLWDQGIVQASLKEMIHCGVFGLEMEPSEAVK